VIVVIFSLIGAIVIMPATLALMGGLEKNKTQAGGESRNPQSE